MESRSRPMRLSLAPYFSRTFYSRGITSPALRPRSWGIGFHRRAQLLRP